MFDGEIKNAPSCIHTRGRSRKRVTTSFYLSLTTKTSTGTADITVKTTKIINQLIP